MNKIFNTIKKKDIAYIVLYAFYIVALSLMYKYIDNIASHIATSSLMPLPIFAYYLWNSKNHSSVYNWLIALFFTATTFMIMYVFNELDTTNSKDTIADGIKPFAIVSGTFFYLAIATLIGTLIFSKVKKKELHPFFKFNKVNGLQMFYIFLFWMTTTLLLILLILFDMFLIVNAIAMIIIGTLSITLKKAYD